MNNKKIWGMLLLFLGVLGTVIFGVYFLLSIYMEEVLRPVPRRDIVFQVYVNPSEDWKGVLGFVNQDGSDQVILHLVQRGYIGKYFRYPFVENNVLGFLTHPGWYILYGGSLQMYREGKILPCGPNLDSRPSPVGQNGTYVGIYQWDEDGGAVLFRPIEKECQIRELWSADELQEMGVFQVLGFHREEAVLLLGKKVPQKYDLTTGDLVPLPWLPASCWGMISRDDHWLACGGYKTQKHRIYSIRVVSLESGELWRERQIPRALVPLFGIEMVSWSPDGKALVYHRCRSTNPEDPEACEELGADNVGIYIWDLETDEERLVTTGGVVPYWIDWGSASIETPSP